MTFVGFGMLHTLIKKNTKISIVFNTLAVVISFQIGLFCNLFWENAMNESWKKGFNSPEGKDIYGFSALATGFWNSVKKNFSNITFSTNFWTATESDSERAYSILLHYLNEDIKAEASNILNGLPIRFVKNS